VYFGAQIQMFRTNPFPHSSGYDKLFHEVIRSLLLRNIGTSYTNHTPLHPKESRLYQCRRSVFISTRKILHLSKYLAQNILWLIAKNNSFKPSYGNISNYSDNKMQQSVLAVCDRTETFNIAAGGK